jgi:FlaA1/EpsC-like NDP-sugar epimerase
MSQRQKTNTINMLKDLKIEMKIMSFAEELSEGSVASRIKDVSTEDLLGRGQISLDQKEVASYLEGKTVMVSGAGGSIGAQLVREIIRYKPKQICMLDMNENGLYLLERDLGFSHQGNQNYEESQLVSLVADIRELDALDTIFDRFKPDVVFHAAAHKHVHLMELRPQEAIKNNVFGTKNMIDCAVKYKVKRFIQISTDKAVNPTNVMGASKRMTELILQARGQTIKTTKFAAVRFGNVLGSSGSVIPIFKAQIARGGPVTLTHRDMTRYFMTIPEAAQLVLQAGYYAKNGDIFVLNMGKPVKIIDLAENLISLSGLEPYSDIDIKEIGLRLGEKMFEELSLQYEKATKTKNNLIFKNRPIKIDQKALTNNLKILQKHVDNHASPDIIKAELLTMIQKGS